MQSDSPRGTAGPRGHRLRAVSLLVAILLVGCAVIWQAQKILRADLVSADARAEILDWGAGESMPASPQTWGAARAAIDASIAITPDDPDMLERMGDVYLAAGKRDWSVPRLRHEDFGHAADWYAAALRLRPSEPQTWAMLAISRQAMGDSGASVHEAWAHSLSLGPYEGHVQPILMQIVLADWPGSTPDMRDWATHLFDVGDDGTRRDINALAAGYGLHFEPDAKSRR